jgi:hypothetical protein
VIQNASSNALLLPYYRSLSSFLTLYFSTIFEKEPKIDPNYPEILAGRIKEDQRINDIQDSTWQAIQNEIRQIVEDDRSMQKTLERKDLIQEKESLKDRIEYKRDTELPEELRPYALHFSAELETRIIGGKEITIPHTTILGQASTRRGTVITDDQEEAKKFSQEHLGWRLLKPDNVDIMKITKDMSDHTRRKCMCIIAHMWNHAIYNAGQHIVPKNSLSSRTTL